MKFIGFLFCLIMAAECGAQSNAATNSGANDLLVYKEPTNTNAFSNTDTMGNTDFLEDNEPLKEELKERGLQNFAEDLSEEKAPMKYYIVIKGFNNIGMANLYIKQLESKGVKNLKIITDKGIYRVYCASTFEIKEVDNLKEKAKLIETEAWVLERTI